MGGWGTERGGISERAGGATHGTGDGESANRTGSVPGEGKRRRGAVRANADAG
jgi:hypothetical protein